MEFIKNDSGNVLITSYQLSKISCSFRELLLTILKCPNLQRAITLRELVLDFVQKSVRYT